MPTVMSHALAAAALATAFPESSVPRRVVIAGVICSMLPDVDALGVCFGLPRGDLLGHRGVTHSLLFAAGLALAALLALLSRARPIRNRFGAWSYLFLAAASHGILDAMTNRAGLGIPFFWPFDSTRHFFSFAPIAMSPLGTDFFSQRGLAVLLNEFQWVWIPSLLFAVVMLSCRGGFRTWFRGDHAA
jgi:inner membrane protein